MSRCECATVHETLKQGLGGLWSMEIGKDGGMWQKTRDEDATKWLNVICRKRRTRVRDED